MNLMLDVFLCRTRHEKPLAVVRGLPGDDAELTPTQLRVLADRLLHIAADAEAQPMHGKKYRAQKRQYLLTPNAEAHPHGPALAEQPARHLPRPHPTRQIKAARWLEPRARKRPQGNAEGSCMSDPAIATLLAEIKALRAGRAGACKGHGPAGANQPHIPPH